jgi:hypothetical protein
MKVHNLHRSEKLLLVIIKKKKLKENRKGCKRAWSRDLSPMIRKRERWRNLTPFSMSVLILSSTFFLIIIASAYLSAVFSLLFFLSAFRRTVSAAAGSAASL